MSEIQIGVIYSLLKNSAVLLVDRVVWKYIRKILLNFNNIKYKIIILNITKIKLMSINIKCINYLKIYTG